MKKIAIVYGSTTDHTKEAAESIAARLSSYEVDVMDVATLSVEQLAQYPNLILGTSTWGSGDLQDDWDSFLPKLKKADLSGKVVSLFGLGDSSSFSDTFVDGMAQIHDALQGSGCTIVGAVGADGYSFDASNAVSDGKFVGLPLDEDNESNLSANRIDSWIAAIEPCFID
jgi:flavodoxin, long chain